MGVMNPGLVMRNIIPVVMAGVLGIYGLIVAVIIQGSSKIAADNFSSIQLTAASLFLISFILLFLQSLYLLSAVPPSIPVSQDMPIYPLDFAADSGDFCYIF